ncbi:hypothetical protein NM208_g13281 [Fusarium decemcellulare]|uniref:Uncharacterized protein n=1 Tax=Fusarium decemcellulare TaxID=57161 RepID=A0ACC1RMB3_9HYPO|nr:hypothetical protein NM208_g13281 [Fusarium decemcellulare]
MLEDVDVRRVTNLGEAFPTTVPSERKLKDWETETFSKLLSTIYLTQLLVPSIGRNNTQGKLLELKHPASEPKSPPSDRAIAAYNFLMRSIFNAMNRPMQDAFREMKRIPAGVQFVPGVAGCGKSFMPKNTILFSQFGSCLPSHPRRSKESGDAGNRDTIYYNAAIHQSCMHSFHFTMPLESTGPLNVSDETHKWLVTQASGGGRASQSETGWCDEYQTYIDNIIDDTSNPLHREPVLTATQ